MVLGNQYHFRPNKNRYRLRSVSHQGSCFSTATQSTVQDIYAGTRTLISRRWLAVIPALACHEWNRKYDPEPPAPEQVLFGDFVRDVYLPWSKIHKGSYDDDVRITSILTVVNRELSVVSKIFTIAARHEEVDANPVRV